MQTRHLVLGAAVLWAQLYLHDARADQPQGTPFTLPQAIELALSANPELRSAALSVAIADGARLQAAAIPNPELSVLSEGLQQATRTQTVQLSQTLELGGKRGARMALAEQDRALALTDISVAEAALRADVAGAYLDALTAQERVALARASLELASKATNAATRRVAAGKISPLEQTRSSVAEAGARLELSQARADAALAGRRLAGYWGLLEPETRPLAAPEADALVMPDLAQLQARLEASPQVRRARMQVAREEAQLRLARAERVPDLTVTLGNKRDYEAGRSQTVVGLSLPLPLFDRHQGNLQSALSRVDKARADAETAYLKAAQALAEAHQRAVLAQEQADSMRTEILPAAQSAFDAAVTGFELGKFGFIDVLDAQRTLFQSRAQYLAAIAARYRAMADLQRHLGAATDNRSFK